MDNPLLDFEGLTRFDQIEPTHVNPAITHLIAKADEALATVTEDAFPANWLRLCETLDTATERLSRAWSAVSHLQSVKDTPELRAAYQAELPKVTDFWTRLGASDALYAKYKAIDPRTLNPEQKHAHALALRNFVLSGAELKGADKTRFAEIQEQLAQLSQTFSEHVLDATDAWSCVVDETEISGIPEDVLQTAKALAESQGKPGYVLTLKMPCYLPVMQYANHRGLREKLYRAYTTRASDQFEFPAFDNGPLIEAILKLREEEAHLLGYANHAEVSLATKMAESPQRVMAFLRDLAARAKAYALQDVAEMRHFAATHLNLPNPEAWDWPFIGEKLKQARYAFSDWEVKSYFTAPRVLEGLFKIIEQLFEVDIQADQAPVWHPGVKFFRIQRQGQLVGQFYLDPGARAGKRGGAWMDDVRSRWLRPDTGHLQTPVAHLVCNFAEGVQGQPPLLTHDDVITLFHECGHGLHHMLTQVNERDVSGISGVEWDAVELPSQFMENFCWEWSVLEPMTAHVETGEPLPRALFDKMLAAKNFQSGLQTLRQIEFALFDMCLHTLPATNIDPMAVLAQVRQEVAVLEPPAFNRMPHSFSHVFAGGYAAGYYSYKWAEVLSADAYAAFEETQSPEGVHSVQTGRRFRECILEAGGSRPAMASFKAFRGREPSLDALMRHQGMATPA